ncbi:MAG: hypothetical protein ACXVZX_15045 [Terriglobales bacterium]
MPSDRNLAVHFFVLFATASLILTANLNAQQQNTQQQKQDQKIEVRDAGGGNKEELVRNAAGDVIEIRTFDANGTFRSRDTTDYIPGHFVPNTTATSYYADGKSVENTTKVTYDENANFLTEFREHFDQTGKHIGGHKLLHDPVNGMFRCWRWNGQSQKYLRVVCPAGEESGEKPPPLKPLTRDEAIKMFEAARTAAAAQQKQQSMVPKNMVTPPERQNEATYTIVLPAEMEPGKKVSGSVVQNAYLLQTRPELLLIEITLPMVEGSNASKLSGWEIEVAGSKPQRADLPFSFTVPQPASQVAIRIYPQGETAKAITRSFPMPKRSLQTTKTKSGYVAQALCVAGDVCPIGGIFNGDATAALAAFDEKPATIVAETSDMAFVRVPDDLLYNHQLLFNEGNELLVFSVVIAQIDIVADGEHLLTFQKQINEGEKKLVFAGVIAAQTLPEDDWKEGIFPRSNLEWARRFVPGFEPPRESHADREEREMMERMAREQNGVKEPAQEKEQKMGYVVFFLKNLTPDIVTWRGAKDGVFALPLTPESFSQGDFRFKFVVEARKTGTYKIAAALIPFIAPVQGQKFTLPPDAQAR